MTDPISGKIAAQMADPAARADQAEMGSDASKSSSSASFDEVMTDVQTGPADQVDGADKVEGVDQIEATAKAQEGPATSRLRGFFDDMQHDQVAMEDMMTRSMSGSKMSQQDLLKMQSLIYGYSQKVELASKVVSNATSGMKQIMNTQV